MYERVWGIRSNNLSIQLPKKWTFSMLQFLLNIFYTFHLHRLEAKITSILNIFQKQKPMNLRHAKHIHCWWSPWNLHAMFSMTVFLQGGSLTIINAADIRIYILPCLCFHHLLLSYWIKYYTDDVDFLFSICLFKLYNIIQNI